MARDRRVAHPAGPDRPRLILDSGAVIALAARKATVRDTLIQARLHEMPVVVPAVVVAEVVRDGPADAPVNWVLRRVDEVAPLTEETARRAGRLLAAANSAATVDALVVAEAGRRGRGVVVTGDLQDLRALARGLANVRIVTV